MATITNATVYLDGGTARTAGETWTLVGVSTLIVRTDTRWHANAPASMTGIIGSIDAYSDGQPGYFIDGSAVRWLQFDTGSGTVPAIGTTITQGSTTGYLLGVWASFTAAPTAVGAAMPASGYLKFREVTGRYQTGTALSGISANPLATLGAEAGGADAAGWIEVVHQAGQRVGFQSTLGLGVKTRGNWFYVDTTTGSAGQIVQIPTNNGGSATVVPGIQVETSPGSGVYEWYQAIITSNWATTLFGTDARSKVVQSLGSGQVRFGNDGGANSIGFVPAAGCKIRVPNVFLRQAAAGTPATNAAPSNTVTSRTGWTMTAGHKVDVEYILSDWYCSVNAATLFNLKNSCVDSTVNIVDSKGPVTIDNVCNGITTAASTNRFFLDVNLSTTSVSNSTFIAASGHTIQYSQNATFTNVIWPRLGNRSGAFNGFVAIVNCKNMTFTDNFLLSGGFSTSQTCENITFTTTDYTDRFIGTTNSTGAQTPFSISTSANVLINGLTFGFRGTFADQQPYDALVVTNGNFGNVKLRNIGTFDTPLSAGSNSSFWPSHFIREGTSTGTQSGKMFVQRVYLTGLRTAIINTSSGLRAKAALVENVGCGFALTSGILGPDFVIRSVTSNYTTANTVVNGYGFRWYDQRTSTTAGNLTLFYSPDSDLSAPYTTLSVADANAAGYTNAGAGIYLKLNDYVIFETPYFIKGYTGFTNTTPTLSTSDSASRFTLEYQLDTGSGYGGTWKALTGANLSAETVPAAGFKIKIKTTRNSSLNGGGQISNTLIGLTTSTTSHRDNRYDLDSNTLSFTGLVAGSEVRCYTGTDPATAVEIGGTESSGTSFSFTHSAGGTAGFIRIFALGYQPFNYDPYTFAAADTTLLVQQVVDRNYVNP